MGPLKRLSRTYHTLQEGMAAADAVFALMDESVALKTRRGGRAAPALQRSIQFERVSFRYEDAPVLQDVDIEILKGEVTAIVGQTGSGKTTLLDLVLGLYAPTSGTHPLGRKGRVGIRPGVAAGAHGRRDPANRPVQ